MAVDATARRVPAGLQWPLGRAWLSIRVRLASERLTRASPPESCLPATPLCLAALCS